MRLAFTLLVSLFAACGSPSNIDGDKYSKACDVANDCVAAYFGDQCDPCTCANALVSVSSRELYEADRSTAKLSCETPPKTACVICASQTVSCEAGVCTLK